MTKNTFNLYEMDYPGEKTYPTQGIRIPQGPADCGGVVPAAARSSSSHGLSTELPTGSVPEAVPVVELMEENAVPTTQIGIDTPTHEARNTGAVAKADDNCSAQEEVNPATPTALVQVPKDIQAMDDIETASVMSFSEDADRERRPVKRKKNKSPREESLSSDSDTQIRVKVKVRNRRQIPDDDDASKDANKVEPDVDKVLFNTEDDIAKKKKVGRPKRKTKAVDFMEAEKEILKKTGKAPDFIDIELLRAMTASDISAQALEYTSHIENIRTKSGRLQGGLSGELKKRILCIEEFIRALQAKAETAGNPALLKYKINQLLGEIRKNKIEEEKRKRELEDLLEVIKDLKRENRNIRDELRKIREDFSTEKDRYSPQKIPRSPEKPNPG